MKRLNILIAIIAVISIGCEITPQPRNTVGPAGRDGLDGLNGEESFVFDYELSFTAPDYNVLLSLPSNFDMQDSDVMLIYFLWEVKDGLEIWRSIPQALYFQDGILNYNYDYSKFDANVFLDGTVNLNGLGADYTDNWIARVVVVPAQFANGRSSLDLTDYEQVKNEFSLAPTKLNIDHYKFRSNI